MQVLVWLGLECGPCRHLLGTVHVQGKQMTLRMLEYWSTRKLDLTDCYLVAVLDISKRSELYSFDQDFDKFNCQYRLQYYWDKVL